MKQKKDTKYPNWSVYCQEGGVLKTSNRGSRIKYDTFHEAYDAALSVFNNYKGQVDVLVLRYEKPYDAYIDCLISRKKSFVQ